MELQLTKGHVARICQCCLWKIEGRKYCAWTSKSGTVYAVRTLRVNGKKSLLYLHHEIAGIPIHDGDVVDHKDGDSLNNSCDNLQIITLKRNTQKQTKLHTTNSSGYRNVTWSKRSRKWQVDIKIDGKTLYIGSFLDKEEAAKAAQQARLIHFGVTT